MIEARGIVARKRTYKGDLYETPKEAVLKLLSHVNIRDKYILEPCCGMYAISNVLIEHGAKVTSKDILYGDDFLVSNDNPIYDYVITNPPYKYAQEFVNKALLQLKDNGQVIMLLRLSFLESTKRKEWHKSNGLKEVLVHSKRVNMYPFNEPKPKNSGTVAYAWYIWEKGYKGKATLDFI